MILQSKPRKRFFFHVIVAPQLKLKRRFLIHELSAQNNIKYSFAQKMPPGTRRTHGNGVHNFETTKERNWRIKNDLANRYEWRYKSWKIRTFCMPGKCIVINKSNVSFFYLINEKMMVKTIGPSFQLFYLINW